MTLSCIALAILGAMSLGEISALSDAVEEEATSLSMQTEISPDFLIRIDDFSQDARQLAEALKSAGAANDLAGALQAIAADAAESRRAFESADNEAERMEAFDALAILLDDAVMLAPMAPGAAADAAIPGALAAR